MITRREWLLGNAAVAAVPLALQGAAAKTGFDATSPLPHKGAFFLLAARI